MVRAVLLLLLLLPLVGVTGCADVDEPLSQGICDEQRPCGLGAICVAGFCQPPPPGTRLDGSSDGRAADRGAPIDRGPDAAPDARPIDRGPVVDRSLGDAAAADRGMDGPDGAAADGAVEPVDQGPPPDMGLPEDCGRFGQACCPGESCRNGGCLDGVCVAFGGVYAFGGLDGACTAGNPLNRNRCQCPAGFRDHPLEDVDFDAVDGLGVFHSVYVCAPEADAPAADLRGAFAVASDPDGAGCPDGCRLGPLQPGCACPEGTSALTFEGVRQDLRGIDACPRSITLCSGAFPLSFGGAYRLWRPQSVACQEIQGAALCVPNPQTGDCSCPDGFDGAAIGMMAPHPTRGAPFYCHSDVVVCGTRPGE